ncbi:MAG: hypothetical protein WCC48_08450 [Anaeromyxobacteraceae bacterium]
MGYHVTILRSLAGRQAPIGREEVEAAVAARSDLTLAPRGEELEITFSAEGGRSPLLIWRDGEVWTSNPDERVLQVMLELAGSLGARVRGDELETYRSVEETFVHPDDEETASIARSTSKRMLRRSRVNGFIPPLLIGFVALAYGFGSRHGLSCDRPRAGDVVAGSGEVRDFLGHFFLPGTALRGEPPEALSLGEGMELLSTGADPCSSGRCNETREYLLEFTPSFLIATRGGRKVVVGADPDAFVDLCDLREARCHRVRGTGTDGDILGTTWVSDASFVVYGIEAGEGFVEVFDLKARTLTTYVADHDRMKPGADRDGFVIARYAGVAGLQAP